ncbi:MAG: Hsp20/alpha crystallin family protein [Lentisphaerae bacterium]|jgi:HSP20 family protein|nr:Hsp20/alpha crystallin family protein [Lentisphaerota bacterium]
MSTKELKKTEAAVPATGGTQAAKPVILTPFVDIMETDKEVILVADMPGVNESNVDIDLQGNNLTIKGARDDKFGMDDAQLIRGEYRPEYCYERQFTIGEVIDMKGISACMKDGVLRLTLPKQKELAPRRIKVKAG